MFCSNCGNQIAQGANFCSGCGGAAPIGVVPAVSDEPRANSNGWMLLLSPLIVIVVGLIGWGVVSSSSQQARLEEAYRKEPSLRPSPVVESSSGNITHDRLMGLSAAGQAVVLGEAVGEGCVGDRAFYMGMHKQESMWSVGCTNGRSYMVKLAADALGSSEVLECSTLRAIAHVNCFVKLSDQ